MSSQGVESLLICKSDFKHEQLYRILREYIVTTGQLDSRFPTMKQLMEKYQVSQATLSRALQALYQEGLLYSVTGKGTFISAQAKNIISRTTAADSPVNSSKLTAYCLVASADMVDPARTSPDWWFTQKMLQGVIAVAQPLKIMVHSCPIALDLAAFLPLAEQRDSLFLFFNYNRCEQLIEYCRKQDIPYAVYANYPLQRQLNMVLTNAELAMEMATTHLIKQGAKNIAFLGDTPNSPRHRGYRRALKSNGLPCPRCWVWTEYHATQSIASQIAEEALVKYPEVDAIAASTDLRAMGAISALQAYPERKVLVAAVDHAWPDYGWPYPFSSVDMGLFQAGGRLLESARQMVASGKKSATIEHITPCWREPVKAR